MDIAYSMAKYIADGGFGTLGTTIFVNQLPSQIDGIYIEQVGGGMDYYTVMQKSFINIYVKDHSASDGITTMANLKKYLHRMVGTEITGGYVYSILVNGDIDSLGRDLENANIYKLGLQVICRDNAIIS